MSCMQDDKQPLMHTYTHTCACAFTYIHMPCVWDDKRPLMHAHVHKYARTHVHSPTCVCNMPCMQDDKQSPQNMYVYIHTQIHTHAYTKHTYVHASTCMYTRAKLCSSELGAQCVHKYIIDTHIYIPTCTYTRMHLLHNAVRSFWTFVRTVGRMVFSWQL